MATKQDVLVFSSGGDLSQAVVTSQWIEVTGLKGYCFQSIWTGSAVGALDIEVSNNAIDPENLRGSHYEFSAPGNHVQNAPQPFYIWARVKYTRVSGSGTIHGTVNREFSR